MQLRVLTSQQVADQLFCSTLTVEEMARDGVIPGIKIGRSWIFPIDTLEVSLNTMANAQAEIRKKPNRSPLIGCEIVPTKPAKKGRARAIPPSLSAVLQH